MMGTMRATVSVLGVSTGAPGRGATGEKRRR